MTTSRRGFLGALLAAPLVATRGTGEQPLTFGPFPIAIPELKAGETYTFTPISYAEVVPEAVEA